jgi:hypothetical protein
LSHKFLSLSHKFFLLFSLKTNYFK